MAEQTFYRYIDAKGDAHFVDAASEVPRDYKGALEKLIMKDSSPATAKAVGMAESAVEHMDWPSFGWGLGIAAVVFLFMRLLALGKRVFTGIALAVALGGVGAGLSLNNLKKHLPSSVASAIPSGASLRDLPSPAEARRILDSLPKSAADRDKTLEAIFQSEKR